MEGYIKLFRKLQNWEWYKNTNTKAVFLHCLLKANYQDKRWQGEIITAGSFVTSLQKMADELCLTVSQTRTAIFNLRSTHDIAIKTTNQNTTITVLNWAVYQSNDTSEIAYEIANETHDISQTNRTQVSKQIATTNKYKELKELKKEELKEIDTKKNPRKRVPPTAFVPPTLEEIIAYVQERKSTVDAKRFYDYFTTGAWKDAKGNQVKNWKQKLITWETRNGNSNNAKPESKPLDTANDGFTYI